jgi:hypothetical protein
VWIFIAVAHEREMAPPPVSPVTTIYKILLGCDNPIQSCTRLSQPHFFNPNNGLGVVDQKMLYIQKSPFCVNAKKIHT